MRIIAGDLSGRVFNPPLKKWLTRPTTDKAREALFNILFNLIDYQGIRALDLYSGSGSIAFEIISRGGGEIVCVDKNSRCIEFIKKTAIELGIEETITTNRGDVIQFLQSESTGYDLIIADPPYKDRHVPQLPELVLNSDTLLNEGGVFVLEHNRYNNFEYHDRCIGMRVYGKSHFTFFR